MKPEIIPMITRLFIIVISNVIFFHSTAYAAPDWTSPHQIKDVVIDNDYTTVIVEGISNPAGCGVATFLRVGKTDGNYEAITAALLSANAQHKPTRLFAATCYGDNSVHITGVWIQP